MKKIQFSQFGTPQEVTECVAIDLPEPKPGEIVVRMLASPVNPADINYIEGSYGVRPELPATPGMEGSGVVEKSCAEGFEVGDKVVFLERVGAWAERLVCRASAAVVVPSRLDSLQAAMLKVNPMTALCLLTYFRELDSGSWIIQNGANSGVGQCVIQVAKALGLRTINLVRREELIPQLKALGADEVFIDDASNKEQLVKFCEEARPVIACNAVGGDSSIRLMSCLVEQGVHITYGAMSRRPVTIPNKYLIFKRIRFEGLWVTKWIEETAREEVEAGYKKLATWILEGRLTQAIDSVYGIESVRNALEHAQESKRSGKVLLSFE